MRLATDFKRQFDLSCDPIGRLFSLENNIEYAFYRNRNAMAKTAAAPRLKNRVETPGISTEAVALSKACIRAARKLGLTNRTLSGIIGLSEPTISRMSKGEFWLSRNDRKSFELSVLFVRLYRSLDAIVGGDERSARSWLNSNNIALGAAPINLIQGVSGLVNVVSYLDSRIDRV